VRECFLVGLRSPILAHIPEIFDEFRDRNWTLLWRGSRNGFTPSDFHSRCDGHNTLTIVRDTIGNIFGCFTPLAWASIVWNGKTRAENSITRVDPSLKTFVFTLHNPSNTSAMRFGLKAERQRYVIYSGMKWGPVFGCSDPDLSLWGRMDVDTESHTNGFGTTFDASAVQERGDLRKFLTGVEHFTVSEIEVVEISQETSRDGLL
jgi:hypothetical protein